MTYRLTAFFAGVALVVSLLAGLLGGVPFGLVALRSLFGCLLFGILGTAAGYVVERFLPEIGAARTGPAETQTDEEQDQDDLAGSGVDIVLPEELPPEYDRRTEAGEGGEAQELEEMAETAGVEHAQGPQAAEPQREGLDSLPSFEAFEDFERDAPVVDSAASGATGDTPFPDEREPGEKRYDTDPEEAAKAVRTWLRRDEER